MCGGDNLSSVGLKAHGYLHFVLRVFQTQGFSKRNIKVTFDFLEIIVSFAKLKTNEEQHIMALSQEQKRNLKIWAIESVVLAIVMVIVYPLIKGEELSIPDTLIGFIIFVVLYILVSSLLAAVFKQK